jgi:hypothetical protein
MGHTGCCEHEGRRMEGSGEEREEGGEIESHQIFAINCC